jgi:hypothetical protein
MNTARVARDMVELGIAPPPAPIPWPEGNSPRPLKVITAAELLKREFTPPRFLFDGFLADGLTLLCGRPKVGKSWLALQLAIDAAMGRAGLGRFAIERTHGVLYAALEEPEYRTQSRLRKFIEGPQVYAENLRFVYQLDPLANGGLASIEEHLKTCPCSLIVIDTLVAANRAERKANSDIFAQDYAAIKALQELAQRAQAAVIVVHHTRKQGADNPLDTVAGTSGITAAADCIMVLQKSSKGAVLTAQGRDMADAEFELTFSDDPAAFGWAVAGAGVEVGMSNTRLEILRALREYGAPMQPKTLASVLDRKWPTIRRLLQKMREAGEVAYTPDGYRIPLSL